MSKGGAGKVYFVLYLAVILELLIIFIERDEAEEGLRKQQQQAIQIVQTILSQLQTGSGVQAITASPKDNIVINDKDPSANKRNYDITVAVGDPKVIYPVPGHPGDSVHGDDVAKLEYIVSHTPNDKLTEDVLGDDTTDIVNGNVLFKAALGTTLDGYKTPRQEYGGGIPADPGEPYFSLNEDKTRLQVEKGRRVKVFSVNFKPNQGPGWYRLRFYSETNRILGVNGEVKDDDTIRIGNIKLTVKQLHQVQKVLAKEKGKPGGANNDQVEKYIETLLSPDAYKNMKENQSSTSFNVHVVRPEAPPPSKPYVTIAARDTVYWYDVAPFSVQVKAGPKEASRNLAGGILKTVDEAQNLYSADIEKPEVTPTGTKISVTVTNAGAEPAKDEKILMVDKPTLRAADPGARVPTNGTAKWRGLSATVGQAYDPSSEWLNTYIPSNDYQTKVWIRGKEVLNVSGVKIAKSPNLVIPDGTKAEDILTRVYWKPGGTSDTNKWKLLLSNQENQGAVIPLEKRKMEVGFPKPIMDPGSQGYDVQFQIKPTHLVYESGDIMISQPIGAQQFPVSVTASCEDCSKYGLDVSIEQGSDDKTWKLFMRAKSWAQVQKAMKELNGKRFDIGLNLQGKGKPSTEGMSITTTVSAR
ncbi:MAG: hypothetical protein JWQ98_2531 [Chlorobi bacterium]|nr:hypothetical protein [Chlorobiota bacterium]